MNPQKDDVDASNKDIIHRNSTIKRHKKRRRARKKHAATNCGTKEPKRPTETQIEWQPQGKVRKTLKKNFLGTKNKKKGA